MRASRARAPRPPPSEEVCLALSLSPQGRLCLEADAEGSRFPSERAAPWIAAFAAGSGEGLLALGAREVGTVLPPAFSFWRDLGARYLAARCAQGEEAGASGPAMDPTTAQALAEAVPPLRGGEYATAERITALWGETDAALTRALIAQGVPVQRFLHELHPAWNVVGRVHFHLAENRKDPVAPFAFLATYSTRLSASGKPQHVPLARALEEHAGARRKAALLALLTPVHRAAQTCPWLGEMLEQGELYHPLRWTAAEAIRFLRDVPALEAAGLLVRMPATWAHGRPARPRVTAHVGARGPAGIGVEALLDFSLEVALDGEALTEEEVATLLSASSGLALLRGRWVEVDPDRLRATLERFRALEKTARRDGVTFAQASRLLADGLGGEAEADSPSRAWAEVVAGPWLAKTLEALRAPEALAALDLGKELHGTLRPYQAVGVRWLHLLSSLGLGACLADDMGLGKTIQVLALLLVRRRERAGRPGPSLLVAPASLLANWAAEAARFAPSLSLLVAHGSAGPGRVPAELSAADLARHDLVVTSYGQLRRAPLLTEATWDLVVLDEAQAIKNASARQTRSAKALSARAKIALTGTPVENRLEDLWSLFDFLNPGLLGSASAFASWTRRLSGRSEDGFGPLRRLVRPYILRRMKTDRRVIDDLPEKTEVTAYCGLTRAQVALYQEALADLRDALAESEGIERRGLVLASLMRFKQICNHPSQWLGDGGWAEAESGKWARLREIAETVSARQEKFLVFTQFREVTEPLAAFLGAVCGRPGVLLHGATSVGERRELVARFQDDPAVPFFVLSLKAGGTGLNLTAASHVLHFDRWWNPAVENQATDRAFRIGQRRPVLVHKFVCRGTVEERIDAMIEAKRGLARDVLEGGAELLLTELPDAEILRLVSLDVLTAMQEA